MKTDIQEAVQEAVHKALDQRSKMEEAIHTAHHAWVQEKKETEERRRRNFDEISRYVIGALVVAAVLAFVYWLGDSAIITLKKWLLSPPPT